MSPPPGAPCPGLSMALALCLQLVAKDVQRGGKARSGAKLNQVTLLRQQPPLPWDNVLGCYLSTPVLGVTPAVTVAIHCLGTSTDPQKSWG